MESPVIQTGVQVLALQLLAILTKNTDAPYEGVNPYVLLGHSLFDEHKAVAYMKDRVGGTRASHAEYLATLTEDFGTGDNPTLPAIEKPGTTPTENLDADEQTEAIVAFLTAFDRAESPLTRRRYAAYLHVWVLTEGEKRFLTVDGNKTSLITMNTVTEPGEDDLDADDLLFGTTAHDVIIEDTNARKVTRALRAEERHRASAEDRLESRTETETRVRRIYWATLAVFALLAGAIVLTQTGLVGVTRSAGAVLGVVSLVVAVTGIVLWTLYAEDTL